MREFKFRAWDKENNAMLYDSVGEEPWESDPNYIKVMHNGILFADSPDMGYYGGGEWSYKRGTFEIMQYTGLNDKNGTEIYEGDIIDGSWINPMSKEKVMRHYQVTFTKGKYDAELIGHHPYGTTMLYFENDKSEVIGNIYENSELLEVNHE